MNAPRRPAPGRSPAILMLAALFIVAGAAHFVAPEGFEAIVPPALPHPRLLVYLSGIAELLGGIGLLIDRTRRAAGWGLILLLLAVFPANVQMLRMAYARGDSALWLAALWLRLPLQPLLIWWVWRAAVRRA